MFSRYLKIRLPGLVLVIGMLASCHPPEIGQITVHPDNKVAVKGEVTLTVNKVTGQKGIQFEWVAPKGGKFRTSTGQTVTYIAPNEPGLYPLTVTATDSGGSTSKSTDIQVILPVIVVGKFVQNTHFETRRTELIAQVGGTGTGLDLTGYKLEMSLEGDSKKTAQLFFKDCDKKNRSSYRYEELNVGPNLDYDPHDPVKHPRAVHENPDFKRICFVGVRVRENSQGVAVTSARLVPR